MHRPSATPLRLAALAVAVVLTVAGQAALPTPAEAAGDPPGTITLASGMSTTTKVFRPLVATDAGLVFEYSWASGNREVKIRATDGTMRALPAASRGSAACTDVISWSEDLPAAVVNWYDTATGATGTAPRAQGRQHLGGAPGGWLEIEEVTPGGIPALRIHRIVASTGADTVLGEISGGAPGRKLSWRGSRTACSPTHFALSTTLDGVTTLRLGSFTGNTLTDVATLTSTVDVERDIRPLAVLGQTVSYYEWGWDPSNLYETEGTVLRRTIGAPPTVVRTLQRWSSPSVAMTATDTLLIPNDPFASDASVYRQPVGGVAVAITGVPALQEGVAWVQGTSFMAGFPGTGTAVGSFPGAIYSVGTRLLTKVWQSSEVAPLTAQRVAAAPGRVLWSDNSAATAASEYSGWQRPMTGVTTMTAATKSAIPQDPGTSLLNLAADGWHTAVDTAQLGTRVQTDSSVRTYRTDLGSFSGHRIAPRWQGDVTDTVTGAARPLTGMVAPKLSGPRVFGVTSLGEKLFSRNLSTGQEVDIHSPVYDYHFATWGDLVVWNDGLVSWRNLRTGASGRLDAYPASMRREPSVYGNYVAFPKFSANGRVTDAVVVDLTTGALLVTLPVSRASELSLGPHGVAWVASNGEPKFTPLPDQHLVPRHEGNPVAPASIDFLTRDWVGEWVFSEQLTGSCTVEIRSGATVVRTLNCNPAAAALGEAVVTWDGTDSSGTPVPSGPFTYAVHAGDVDGPAVDADGTSTNISGPITVVNPKVARWAGTDRYATSAAISASTFGPNQPVVYIASGEGFADALSGAPVAGWNGAPLLLVTPDGIPPVIDAEIKRLAPEQIIILGGPGAVSSSVATALDTLAPGRVTRLWGADRYATSAQISLYNYDAGVGRVYLANGENFPDALSGAPAAGATGSPLLLTTATSLPAPIATELTRLKPKEIVILGGTGVISGPLQTTLASYTTGPVTRLAGPDRYATSAAISAATYQPGVPAVFLASGENFPDALTGAPIAAATGSPLLLTPPTSIPTPIDTELTRLAAHRLNVLGGTGVITSAVETAARSYLP
ncbi:MAG: cell wall-binding repeat-containing protein [Actinomycetales bacterium]|nr:cell wall-binding repeat-containing protein [Actinomycetales bacterium]